ncbi:hypothetical protein AR543_p0181 (plasmid) [Paenibacillus bovis]|uniref:YolD-like family protein n=1 Tax=Paenibacillus bovis TaxID=1616788 RepID=A0A1X9T4J0_9BACL|nr:hypothetical protein AR543_p0181 [Paenibacillus bovis]
MVVYNISKKISLDKHQKWGGLFLPEHRDRLQEWLFAQEDVPRPVLSADQLEELNHALHRHLMDHRPVTVSFYQDKRIQQLRGILHSCDVQTRVLVVYDSDYEAIHLKLDDVVAITS